MPSPINATRAPPGTSSWTENQLGYLDGDRYTLNRIKPYHGGVEIHRQRYDGLKVAIPSSLAAELGSLMFRVNRNCIGGNTPRERSRWALKETMSKYRGDRVLLDMTSDDEQTLRHIIGTNDIEMGDLLCQNPDVLPKVFKDWVPNNTELNVSPDGFKVVFRDSAKRALIKVVCGDYKETSSETSKSSSSLGAPARNQSPKKRKAADPQHKDRTNAALTQTSRTKGLKQPKIGK